MQQATRTERNVEERAHPKDAPSAPMPAVSVEPGFDFLSPDYARLFEASSATAFQHPVWLDALYARLAPMREAEKLVVTGRERDGGALVFVLPMILRRKSGALLLETSDLGVGDYAAPIVARGFHGAEGLADAVAAVLPRFDVMRIRPVREETVAAWRMLLGGTERRLDFSAHATALAGTYADWRAGALDASFARYLDRKKKRFGKSGGALRLLRDCGEIEAAITRMRELRAGRFPGDLIQQGFVRDFYAAVAAAGAPAGLARTYALVLEGEAVGYVFGLTHGGRFHYLLIGCDYERHGRHSPGLVLYDAIIADWIAAGGTVFDFTIGDEAFKADFGTEPTAMFEIAASTTWRGSLARAGLEARDQFRRLGLGRRKG